MSNTFKSQVSRGSNLKVENQYTGYLGESCFSQHGRKWFKKMIHKLNRRVAKMMIQSELKQEH